MACLKLLFYLSTILLADLQYPDFFTTIGPATLKNLTLQRFELGATHGTFNSSLMHLATFQPTNISCAVHLRIGALRSVVMGEVQLLPSNLLTLQSINDNCLSTTVYNAQCRVPLKMTQLRSEPPNELVNMMLHQIKNFVESQMERYICDVAVPYIHEELLDHSIPSPLDYPKLVEGATPLENTPMFRSLVNVINHLPEIYGIRLDASIHAGTSVHLQLHLPHGMHFTYMGKDESTPGSFMRNLIKLLEALHSQHYAKVLSDFLFLVQNDTLNIETPHPFNVSIDLSLHDLRCDAAGIICTIPRTSGLTVQNIRTEQFGGWDHIIVAQLGPLISSEINRFIKSFCSSIPVGVENERLFLPVSNADPVIYTTAKEVWISVLFGAVCIFAIGIFFSFWCHRKAPVLGIDGLPISLRRVIVEDTILLLMGLTAVFGFVWSNITTAAAVEMGGELELLSFSLMETTRNLYNAGLKPLAVLIFLFSGIYPYLKILTILVWTLVLQKPSSTILKLVDYFGKFSFLDSFAMVIMASGLQVAGIAEVKILPGFYVFLSATILSVLTGNYATTLWRRNTSLRHVKLASASPDLCTTRLVNSDPLDETSVEESECEGKIPVIVFRVLSGLFVACCVIPAWVVPCLRYRVTGFVSLIETKDRNMTLYELSCSSLMLFITCIVTVGIAPVIYAVMHDKWSLFASWGAADALLLACVAGLLQIGQFVEFIIGKDMNVVYHAEAHLLWPLIPLLISVVYQWFLVVDHLFSVSLGVQKRWQIYQTKRELAT